jgi:uncharacterized protein (DUF433 family)
MWAKRTICRNRGLVLKSAVAGGNNNIGRNKMNRSGLITSNPNVRSGKPCIRDTRMTVTDVLEYLAGGMTEDELLGDFPYLTREDIRACLGFAAERGG